MKRIYLFLTLVLVLMPCLAHAEVIRTPRDPNPTASERIESTTTYIGPDGELVQVSLTRHDDPERVIREFDAEQVGFESGYLYIGEDKRAPEGCRIVGYSQYFYSHYIALCADDGWGLYVVGQDYPTVRYVAEQFSEGKTNLRPPTYTFDH